MEPGLTDTVVEFCWDIWKGRKESRSENSPRDLDELVGDRESNRAGIIGEPWNGGSSSSVGDISDSSSCGVTLPGWAILLRGLLLGLSSLLLLLLLIVKFPFSCGNNLELRSFNKLG